MDLWVSFRVVLVFADWFCLVGMVRWLWPIGFGTLCGWCLRVTAV